MSDRERSVLEMHIARRLLSKAIGQHSFFFFSELTDLACIAIEIWLIFFIFLNWIRSELVEVY
jgi:hypothetical protein